MKVEDVVGIAALDADAMADALDAGRLTASALVDACLNRIAQCEDVVGAWAFLDPEIARRQAAESDARRKAAWAAQQARRRACRHQGHLRYRRHADRERHRTSCRSPAGERLRGGSPAPRRRRHCHGQDSHHRACRLFAGQDAQSARSRPLARRLVERLGRRGGSVHGAAGRRNSDQRVGHPPGGLLWRRRLQADARADPA